MHPLDRIWTSSLWVTEYRTGTVHRSTYWAARGLCASTGVIGVFFCRRTPQQLYCILWAWPRDQRSTNRATKRLVCLFWCDTHQQLRCILWAIFEPVTCWLLNIVPLQSTNLPTVLSRGLCASSSVIGCLFCGVTQQQLKCILWAGYKPATYRQTLLSTEVPTDCVSLAAWLMCLFCCVTHQQFKCILWAGFEPATYILTLYQLSYQRIVCLLQHGWCGCFGVLHTSSWNASSGPDLNQRPMNYWI